MECSLETREDSGFRGKQYFSPELLPERLKARAFRLNGEGAFENREDVTVLSIRRGKGRMVLNNRVYPLEPGMVFILYPYHVWKAQADEGCVLEGEECVMNMGAMLFCLPSRPTTVQCRYLKRIHLFTAWIRRISAAWNGCGTGF